MKLQLKIIGPKCNTYSCSLVDETHYKGNYSELLFSTFLGTVNLEFDNVSETMSKLSEYVTKKSERDSAELKPKNTVYRFPCFPFLVTKPLVTSLPGCS